MFKAIQLAICLPVVAVGCFHDWDDDPHAPREGDWICRPAGSEPPRVACPSPRCPSGLEALYLSGDPRTCAAIDFACPPDYRRFDAPCGCGCLLPEPEPADPSVCPETEVPEAVYLGTLDKVCDEVEFTCPQGQERFDSACGCGCWPSCPDPADPRVHYLSEDAELCGAIDFVCPDDCHPFDDRCGCGCIEPEPPPACPDPEDPAVHYVSTDPSICARLTLTETEDCRVFDDACGCGCIE